jgi:diaminohydroxyphosphoribosylaminopyrimidine deaminase/5-amino-6-(5-phosphoribosylamino)uracil reductase
MGKTPPCTDLIIQSGIRHVVIGMQDPFEKVNGRGIQKLRHAGVRVDVGIEVAACRELNKRFVTTIEKQRPLHYIKVGRNSRWIYCTQNQNGQTSQCG